MKKNNLDEQQERRLLEIESRGFWLSFWGLLAVLFVEMLLERNNFYVFAGELILFLAVGTYMSVACIRAGIWDRRLDMSRRSSLLAALIVGLVILVFGLVFSRLRAYSLRNTVALSVIAGTITFALAYAVLRLEARAVKKRQDALNAEPDEE